MSISLNDHERRIKELEAKIDKIANSSTGLGVKQSWVNVKSSRSLNTDYVNDTPNPIAVAVATVHTNGITFYAYVNDIPVARTSKNYEGYNGHSIFTIVPPGAKYKITCTKAIELWCELR